MSIDAFDLETLCRDLEAFETPKWAVDEILKVEIFTRFVVDPCVGTGILMAGVERATMKGHRAHMDIMDWSRVLNCPKPQVIGNFLDQSTDSFFDTLKPHLSEATFFMNPPFSTACEFVDRARALGARKIVCFQRQAWRETDVRRAWWEANPPARTWLCGGRAACWRFDLLDCQEEGGTEACPKFKRKGKKHETQGCAKCMGSTPTAHAWYVWERGHRGAEINNTIYPLEKVKP